MKPIFSNWITRKEGQFYSNTFTLLKIVTSIQLYVVTHFMGNQNVTKSVPTHPQKETSCTVLNRHMHTHALHIYIWILTDEISQNIHLNLLVNSYYIQKKKSKSLSLIYKVLHNCLHLLYLAVFLFCPSSSSS